MKNDLKKMPQHIWFFNTVGKAVHNAITLFYHLPIEERTIQNLKEQLKIAWRSEAMFNKKPPLGKWGGFKTIEEERTYYSEALQMLQIFFKMYEPDLKIISLPTNNLRNSIDDYNKLITKLNDSCDISGKFDLVLEDVDGSLHIIDFKTGKKEDVNNFQLRFYKVLAEEKFKLPVKKATFYYLRTGKKVEFDLTLEDSSKIKEEILSKINDIKNTKKFESKPSKLCKFCLFITFCPANQEVREIIKDVKDDYPEDLPF